MVRTQWLVKRSVDLDGVKKFRKVSRLVESFGASRGIDVAGPVWIRPARGADSQNMSWRGKWRANSYSASRPRGLVLSRLGRLRLSLSTLQRIPRGDLPCGIF